MKTRYKYIILGILVIGLVITSVLVFSANRNDFTIISDTFQLKYPLKLTKYT